MEMLNKIMEDDNTLMVSNKFDLKTYINKDDSSINIDHFIYGFKAFVLAISDRCKKESKFNIDHFVLYGDTKVINKYKLISLNDECSPIIRVISHDYMHGEHLLLVPQFTDCEDLYINYIVQIIKLVQ